MPAGPLITPASGCPLSAKLSLGRRVGVRSTAMADTGVYLPGPSALAGLSPRIFGQPICRPTGECSAEMQGPLHTPYLSTFPATYSFCSSGI